MRSKGGGVDLSFRAVFDGVAALHGEPTAMPKCGPACREYERVEEVENGD